MKAERDKVAKAFAFVGGVTAILILFHVSDGPIPGGARRFTWLIGCLAGYAIGYVIAPLIDALGISLPTLVAVVIFAELSTYCSLHSDGFIENDACAHYLSARYAFDNPQHFVDVWNRPLAIGLYAVPARLGDRAEGRVAVHVVCMLVAIGCGLISYRIARTQSAKWPVLALIFTLGQPMLFLHSFSEMQELPFALLLGLVFLAYQARWFFLAAMLAAWLPLGRPEGLGLLAIFALALILHRKWVGLLVLPIPLLLWNLAGWHMIDSTRPWYRWLWDAWPYAKHSLYGHGQIFALVGMLPTIISPIVMPAMILGIGLSLRGFRWRFVVRQVFAVGRALPAIEPLGGQCPPYAEQSTAVRPVENRDSAGGEDSHATLCRLLTVLLPLFVLGVHSLLYWLGSMGSFGEARYLLVVAPFWGVLSARGWEWVFNRLEWKHPLRWAAAAALLPPIIANAVHPIVPAHLREDWQIAQRVAKWYRSDPSFQARYPKVMAAHPAIAYFLDIDPYGSPQVRSFDVQTLHEHKPGTVLIWDPVHGNFNSSADRAFPWQEASKYGWKEISSGGTTDAVQVTHPDPKAGDVGGAWHVFESPEPALISSH